MSKLHINLIDGECDIEAKLLLECKYFQALFSHANVESTSGMLSLPYTSSSFQQFIDILSNKPDVTQKEEVLEICIYLGYDNYPPDLLYNAIRVDTFDLLFKYSQLILDIDVGYLQYIASYQRDDVLAYIENTNNLEIVSKLLRVFEDSELGYVMNIISKWESKYNNPEIWEKVSSLHCSINKHTLLNISSEYFGKAICKHNLQNSLFLSSFSCVYEVIIPSSSGMYKVTSSAHDRIMHTHGGVESSVPIELDCVLHITEHDSISIILKGIHLIDTYFVIHTQSGTVMRKITQADEVIKFNIHLHEYISMFMKVYVSENCSWLQSQDKDANNIITPQLI